MDVAGVVGRETGAALIDTRTDTHLWSKTYDRALDDLFAVQDDIAGTVVEVKCKPGDAVTEGQILLVVEAMKMQHQITAPVDGTVAAVAVRLGQQVAVFDRADTSQQEVVGAITAGELAFVPGMDEGVRA